jgi:hypothetical protein
MGPEHGTAGLPAKTNLEILNEDFQLSLILSLQSL